MLLLRPLYKSMNLSTAFANSLRTHLLNPRCQWAAQDALLAEGGGLLGHCREGEGSSSFSAAWVLATPEGKVQKVGWQCSRAPGRAPLLSILCTALMDEVESAAGLTLMRLMRLTLEQLGALSGVIPGERWEETSAALRLIQRAARGCQSGRDPSKGVEDLLCDCWGVSRAELEAVLRAGKPLSEAQRTLGLGSSCGGCWPAVLECASRWKEEGHKATP